MAKQIRLPQEIRNWTLLTDEEKCANVLTSLLGEGGLQELVELRNHHHGNGTDNGCHDPRNHDDDIDDVDDKLDGELKSSVANDNNEVGIKKRVERRESTF